MLFRKKTKKSKIPVHLFHFRATSYKMKKKEDTENPDCRSIKDNIKRVGETKLTTK